MSLRKQLPEIKCCLFCGSRDSDLDVDESSSIVTRWSIHCYNCDARGPCFDFENQEKAIEAWNRTKR